MSGKEFHPPLYLNSLHITRIHLELSMHITRKLLFWVLKRGLCCTNVSEYDRWLE